MDKQSKFNLAGNFLHIGGGEYVPTRNIKSVEILTDDDRAQIAENLPKARGDFQYRIQFWDRNQRLAVDLDAAPGTFVQVDKGVLMPIANLQGLKPLTKEDFARLRERFPQAERPFQTRIEGNEGQSFLSTWSVEQITGAGEEPLPQAPAPQRRGRSRNGAEPKVAG